MSILTDLKRNRSYSRCAFCGKPIEKDGKTLNGKFYHNVCCDKVVLKMACRDNIEPKKIYIAV